MKTITCCLAVALCAGLHAAEPTVITVTGKPLVKDVSRFGINLGGGSKEMMARIHALNFEGMMYRQSHIGVLHEDVFVSFNGVLDGEKGYRAKGWDKLAVGSTATILSGPAKWTKVKIARLEARDIKIWDQAKKGVNRVAFVFDKKIKLPDGKPIEGMGFMVAFSDPNLGASPFHEHEYWDGNLEIVQGDVPPGSFGKSALLIKGTAPKGRFGAFFRLQTQKRNVVEIAAKWHLQFWAKIKTGAPTLKATVLGSLNNVKLGKEWARHEVVVEVAKGDKGGETLLQVKGGDILLDDLTMWKEEEPENPTVFTDETIAIMQDLKPGIIRTLQMGGSSMERMLRPVLQGVASRGGLGSVLPGAYGGPKGGTRRFSMYEYYALAEHLDTEPWLCLPGTLQLEEMDQFMEFIGAPADVGWGKVRAEQGHAQPWTESLGKIHVEFGNEAWNFFGPYVCGGYDGPDYWQDLIARAKKSKYYKPNVVFHVAGRGWAGYAQPSKDITNADRYTWAPYIIHKMSKAEEAALDTDERTYRWIFGAGVSYARKRRSQADEALKNGAELSVYEVNHHITSGDASDAAKNKIVPSLGAGLNVMNSMLIWMKENHARNQCFFTLQGNYYAIRLWGGMLGMKKGAERYRPTWLALSTANKVVGGDLVQTTHSPGEPTFVPLSWDKRKKQFTDGDPLPVIWSYAFVQGETRGLILMNLDITTARDVVINLPGVPMEAATQWRMSSAKISDNNEWEVGDDPPVKVAESRIEGFKSGQTLTLPAHSMTALQWQVQ
jgi:hypothetical protein